jgi:hypothetical protein
MHRPTGHNAPCGLPWCYPVPVLTHSAVAKYVPHPRHRREIRDDGARGLYLIIQPTGSKSWALRFRRPNGKPAKLTLGDVVLAETLDEPVLGSPMTLGQARELAASLHRRRKKGLDVIEDCGSA